MASQQQVKQYLAYWFQLGKRVRLNHGQDVLQPRPVIMGDRFSPEFEACWQRVMATGGREAHLEGTHQTIAELLTPAWEIDPCARCAMLVPVKTLGLPPECCPCFDLPNWPDTENPAPRLPVDTDKLMMRLRDRLNQANQK
jgi:hypothetical protein